MMIASSANALEKSLDFDLALNDFPYWLLCVLLEDSTWTLGSCVRVCLMKIASSANALDKKKGLDFDLALDDFPDRLLCVLLEDSIWALGSCVHVCLLKMLWRSPILKDKILFTCANVMVTCSVL